MNSSVNTSMAVVLMLTMPPLLPGIISRIKALVAGRSGPPLFQLYFDLLRLTRKGIVYSSTTTWIFRAAPVVTLMATLLAGTLLPLGMDAPLAFDGDLILFAYLLGLGRFFVVCAALDTGSSFEGMGSSREAAFSALTEIVLFLVLVTLVIATQQFSLSSIFSTLAEVPSTNPALWVAVAALFAVLLVENARIPIDNPTTHLELTMIHEVMILDHSGPDLAMLEYASALKLFVTSVLIVGIINPGALKHIVAVAFGTIVVASVIGFIESSMARLRLPLVKQFLIGSFALAAVALAAELLMRGDV